MWAVEMRSLCAGRAARKLTKIDANGTLVDFVTHDFGFGYRLCERECGGGSRSEGGGRKKVQLFAPPASALGQNLGVSR